MRGRHWILVGVLAFALVGSAIARIGDNQAQHIARYGHAVGDTTNTSIVTKGRVKKEYLHHAWHIKVTFYDDRAIRIVYRTPNTRPLTESDIHAILDDEKNGGPWYPGEFSSRTNEAGWRAHTGFGSYLIEDLRTLEQIKAPKPNPPVPDS